MIHPPSILALILVSWNISECTKSPDGVNTTTSDRVAVSIAFALIIECLFLLSYSILAWLIISPGILALIVLSCYRAFLGVKDMHISSLNMDDFFFLSSII